MVNVLILFSSFWIHIVKRFFRVTLKRLIFLVVEVIMIILISIFPSSTSTSPCTSSSSVSFIASTTPSSLIISSFSSLIVLSILLKIHLLIKLSIEIGRVILGHILLKMNLIFEGKILVSLFWKLIPSLDVLFLVHSYHVWIEIVQIHRNLQTIIRELIGTLFSLITLEILMFLW